MFQEPRFRNFFVQALRVNIMWPAFRKQLWSPVAKQSMPKNARSLGVSLVLGASDLCLICLKKQALRQRSYANAGLGDKRVWDSLSGGGHIWLGAGYRVGA